MIVVNSFFGAGSFAATVGGFITALLLLLLFRGNGYKTHCVQGRDVVVVVVIVVWIGFFLRVVLVVTTNQEPGVWLQEHRWVVVAIVVLIAVVICGGKCSFPDQNLPRRRACHQVRVVIVILLAQGCCCCCHPLETQDALLQLLIR